MKFNVLGLEAVGLGFAAAQLDPLQSQFDRYVEDQSEVSRQIADRNPLQALDEPLIDLAQDALINARGIGKAVANHPFTGTERGQDGTLHMIVTGSSE